MPEDHGSNTRCGIDPHRSVEVGPAVVVEVLNLDMRRLVYRVWQTQRDRDGYVDRVQRTERQLDGIPAPTDGKDMGDDHGPST